MRKLTLLCSLLFVWSVALGDAQDPTRDWRYFGNWAAMSVDGGSRAMSFTSEDGIWASIDFTPDQPGCSPALVLHLSDGKVSDIGRLDELDVRIEFRVDRNDIWYIDRPTLVTQQSMDGRRAVDMVAINTSFDFVEEVRTGKFLRLKVGDLSAFRVDLNGSMAALDLALNICRKQLGKLPSDEEFFQNSDDVYF